MNENDLEPNTYDLHIVAERINEQIDAIESLGLSGVKEAWKSKYAKLQHDQEKKSVRESLIDPLTGLYNRRVFDVLLEIEFNETRRGMQTNEVIKQAPMVLVLFDIDHLKEYNDEYGHPAGDKMLKKVANIARRCFRDSDILARIGGDEFAAILPRTRATEALTPIERLRDTVSRQLGKQGVTISIGMSDIADFMERGEDLYKLVDNYLFKGKEAGRDQIWHPLRDAAERLKAKSE